MTTQAVADAQTNTQTLFDAHGRCIPSNLTTPVYPKSRHYFEIKQPEINYAQTFERISKHLGTPSSLTVEDFEQKAESIKKQLESDASTQAITQGVGVPFFLPKATYNDIGEAIETKFIPAMGNSYAEKYPDYEFVSHIVGSLKDRFTVAPDTRHDALIDQVSQEDVVGYYFPCLLEYSIPATREIMKSLPEQFLLSGGYDTFAAVIGSPELLFNKDKYAPLLWLAALEGEKTEASYHFEAYGYNLTFNRKPHLGDAAEYWGAGLSILG